MSGTVTKVDATAFSELHRHGNRALMVAWINADLLNRAHHDVRKSVVLLDGDKDFVCAVDEVPYAVVLQELYDKTPVRFYSEKGI